MGSNPIGILVLISLCFSCLMLSVQSKKMDASKDCKVTEREALTNFKEMLVDPSDLLSSWAGENCCRWIGITCSNETGNVIKINLSNKACYSDAGLQNSSCIGGQISPSLLDLKYLSYLDLSFNDFQTPIPEFLGSIEMLIYLNLSFATFTGMVPPYLGNLSNLQYLDLSTNPLWVSDMIWISGLTSLEYLYMGYLNLSLASSHWLWALNFLPHLSEIHLPFSNLQILPDSLPNVNFTQLSVIELTSNGFDSFFPKWVSNLSSLVTLDLTLNEIKGDIGELVGDLAKCCSNSLEELVLPENKISGQFTNSLALLKKLRVLYLPVNSISGFIPTSIGNLTKLEVLELGYNQMNGSIPESIKNLANLEALSLLENNWQGIFSQNQLQGLKKLISFSLSSKEKNFILILSDDWVSPFSLKYIEIKNCNLGPNFPVWIKAHEQLSNIILSDVGISDFLPDWFWSFSSKLRWCVFSNNKIKGMLPSSLPHLQDLYYLNLAGNLFSGSIPSSIAQALSSVVHLNLSGNCFTGPIPYFIGELKELYSLDLSRNKFSGEIDQDYWKNFKSLSILDLSMNNLSGFIPGSLISLQKLSYLKLSDNNLSGNLSFSPIINGSFLSLLDLGGNKFSGMFPKWIGELLLISELRLRNNMLSGSIPEELCSRMFLHILDISSNNFSGEIPECLGNLVFLKMVYPYVPPSPLMALNQIPEMELVFKGREMVYTNILKLVNILDFSNNNFTGEIPKDITRLSTLGALNLSRNQLTGQIPREIAALHRLETLDLSYNHFSGQIPPSMTSMTLLNHLNLSNNNLSGPIPMANQFLTFNDPSIYNGNAELCGSPLQTKCGEQSVGDGKDSGPLTDDQRYEDNWNFGFFISMGFGFVFGFWAAFGSLAIYRPWRLAFFHHVDNMINSLDIAFARSGWDKIRDGSRGVGGGSCPEQS